MPVLFTGTGTAEFTRFWFHGTRHAVIILNLNIVHFANTGTAYSCTCKVLEY